MCMYEIAKFMVYMQVYSIYCIVYSKLLLLTSLQVYSLQQIVATYKSLTNQWAITHAL